MLDDDKAYVAALLDAYGRDPKRDCALTEDLDEEDGGVPPAMWDGPVSEDGWVSWKLLPSTVSEADVAAVEEDFGITVPQLYRAYLLARFHYFRDGRSAKHDEAVSLPAVPCHRPLAAWRELLEAGRPLIGAGYVACATWGDGYGLVCFDLLAPGADGEPPLVWLDHDELTNLDDEDVSKRDRVQHLAQPLYASFREMLEDVFGRT